MAYFASTMGARLAHAISARLSARRSGCATRSPSHVPQLRVVLTAGNSLRIRGAEYSLKDFQRPSIKRLGFLILALTIENGCQRSCVCSYIRVVPPQRLLANFD